MIVETKVLGQPAELADVPLDLPPGSTTLRALIDRLVADQLDRYEQRRAGDRILRVLSPAELAEGYGTGRWVGGREVPAAPSAEVARTRAIEAFEDGLVIAFLDDVQLDDLDAAIELSPTSRLRLMRLVALAGG